MVVLGHRYTARGAGGRVIVLYFPFRQISPSQKLAEIDDPAKREELLQALAHGSAAAWGHLNLLGEYDFSEDKLQDSVGIKPPKLSD